MRSTPRPLPDDITSYRHRPDEKYLSRHRAYKNIYEICRDEPFVFGTESLYGAVICLGGIARDFVNRALRASQARADPIRLFHTPHPAARGGIGKYDARPDVARNGRRARVQVHRGSLIVTD